MAMPPVAKLEVVLGTSKHFSKKIIFAAAASEPERASKAADLIFMYMYYIYADEISIVSAYFGLPQCTAFGPAGYSCLINRHKANKQCDHLSSLVFLYSLRRRK